MDSRLDAVIEEIQEVESLAELEALIREVEYAPYVVQCKEVIEAVRSIFADAPIVVVPVVDPVIQPKSTEPVVRAGRKYRLLKTDVSWTTKPQVQAIMSIIEAHMSVGDTIDEETILQMLELNKAVLVTRQPVQKVWNYYKGNSDDGLQAHGNLKRI